MAEIISQHEQNVGFKAEGGGATGGDGGTGGAGGVGAGGVGAGDGPGEGLGGDGAASRMQSSPLFIPFSFALK